LPAPTADALSRPLFPFVTQDQQGVGESAGMTDELTLPE
jgi:hypothetical protein